MLQEYGHKTICPLTIYHWLKKLGFVYELRKKGYYVDGHERPLMVKYQNNLSNDISPMKDECTNGFRSHKMKAMHLKQRG